MEPQGTIVIRDFRFTPTFAQVAADSAITFRNDDEFDHQIALDFPGGTHPRLGPSDTDTFTIGMRGSFTYHCAIHNSMTGSIEVG